MKNVYICPQTLARFCSPGPRVRETKICDGLNLHKAGYLLWFVYNLLCGSGYQLQIHL